MHHSVSFLLFLTLPLHASLQPLSYTFLVLPQDVSTVPNRGYFHRTRHRASLDKTKNDR